MSRLSEVLAFLRGVVRNWQALILGGFVAIALTLWQWFGSPLAPIWYGVVLVLTFLPAVYITWRDEYRKANIAQREVARLQETAKNSEKRNPAIWKPSAALQNVTFGQELRNELVLKDSRLFELLSVELLFPNGAKAADISITPNQESMGFRVHIPHGEILKLWNRGGHSGSIKYNVRRGYDPYTGIIPFVAEEAVVANTYWIRLVG